MTMKNHKKFIFCESCYFKKILNEEDLKNFTEIKSSPIQFKIPESKSKKDIEFKNIVKKIKCPKCGRGVVVKNLAGAYKKTIKEIEEKLEEEKQKIDKQKRIEDGKPQEKIRENDF
jgi:hypothetical protein